MAPEARLTVDLIPAPCWGRSLAHLLPESEWTWIRREVYRESGYRCSVCRAKGTLHADEVWEFRLDTPVPVQRLVDIRALCEACHAVKHIGRTGSEGGDRALAAADMHMRRVNGWSEAEVEAHVDEAFRVWDQLSKINDWEFDVFWAVDKFRIETPQLPNRAPVPTAPLGEIRVEFHTDSEELRPDDVGVWAGSGAAALGLSGEVTAAEATRIMNEINRGAGVTHFHRPPVQPK